jgi:hypothetical protein
VTKVETLDPHRKTHTIFLDCTDPIRIRIPSTSKKIKKNLDFYSFVTSFMHTYLKIRQALFIIFVQGVRSIYDLDDHE